MKKEPNLSRRVLVYAVMAFCMTMLVWLMWNGQQDGELHKLIATGCFYTMGCIVLFYVLGGNLDLALHVLSMKFGNQPSPHVPLKRKEIE